VRGHEADQGGADQEGGVPEAHHEGQATAAADVAGQAVDLGRDQADTQPDQAPTDQDDDELPTERGEQVAGQGADRPSLHDHGPAEALDDQVTEQPDHHHEAGDSR